MTLKTLLLHIADALEAHGAPEKTAWRLTNAARSVDGELKVLVDGGWDYGKDFDNLREIKAVTVVEDHWGEYLKIELED